MTPEKESLLKQELAVQLDFFEKAIRSLQHSYRKCQTIRLEQEFSDDVYEPFDALTSRFARASDILTQKVLGLFDELELEDRGSLLDRYNRAAKKGILSSVEEMKRIRELRNEIAHEYAARSVVKIFADVMAYTPNLIALLEPVQEYSRKFTSPQT